jgi:hypothetical protein
VGSVRFYDLASGRLLRTLRGHFDPVLACVFRGGDSHQEMLSAGKDQSILIWHPAEDELAAQKAAKEKKEKKRRGQGLEVGMEGREGFGGRRRRVRYMEYDGLDREYFDAEESLERPLEGGRGDLNDDAAYLEYGSDEDGDCWSD